MQKEISLATLQGGRGEGDIFAEGRLTVAIQLLSPLKIQGFFIGKLTEQVAYAVFYKFAGNIDYIFEQILC